MIKGDMRAKNSMHRLNEDIFLPKEKTSTSTSYCRVLQSKDSMTESERGAHLLERMDMKVRSETKNKVAHQRRRGGGGGAAGRLSRAQAVQGKGRAPQFSELGQQPMNPAAHGWKRRQRPFRKHQLLDTAAFLIRT